VTLCGRLVPVEQKLFRGVRVAEDLDAAFELWRC
jgi:hypothetical protein